MKFLWPEFLFLLALVPLLALLYVWLLRRRKRLSIRYANLSLVKEALGRGAGWRRHVPPVLFLLGLASLLVAVARPTAVLTLPSQYQTIILAMDVSGSMRAADVDPNRLTASQVAAKTFVSEQPRNARIGVVSFAGTAALVQTPTQNKEDIVAAIDRFQLQRGTAIGSGIIVSLAAIFPDAGIDIGALTYGRSQRSWAIDQKQDKPPHKPVPPGSYNSAVIILLTDGQRTTGPDSIEAAKMAADRGVRVFTVGVGTPQGEIIGFEGWSMRVRLDEETLKQIANITHGEYFYAGTAVDLKKIYENLNSRLVLEKRETEVSALFAAIGALLSVIAAALSVYWFHRIL
ncbi:MAG TPA: VWA domain-containing protein [Casimicrobiaceae bacterium]|nr:VWA domain-containing protein [Casimicrobiaceae bacterium]